MTREEMVVIVTGGRYYSDVSKLEGTLSALKPDRIVHGGCSGADRLAHYYAREWRIPIDTHVADWKKHGKAAGPIRNRRMIEMTIELYGIDNVWLVAFPGGKGTENCKKEAVKLGVKIVEVTQ